MPDLPNRPQAPRRGGERGVSLGGAQPADLRRRTGSARLIDEGAGEGDRRWLHLRPVWIVLLLLLPCLVLTVYYSQ
jgi:hypothetical protein